jgi:hypothetical protein
MVTRATRDVTTGRAYAGVNATGRVMHFCDKVRDDVRDPVIFVWGFDPDSSEYKEEQIVSLLNGEHARQGEPGARLLDTLVEAGHDVFVLLPNDSATFLQANAMLLVELLEWIYGKFPETGPNTIVGLSAGGVISRWALLHMEDHYPREFQRTVRYFSFDTPHRGANVPPGIQYFLNNLDACVRGANSVLRNVPLLGRVIEQALDGVIRHKVDLVNSIAARQLASHHYGPGNFRPGSNPGPDPLRHQLVAELGGRWPRGVARYAIANGSGYGTPQAIAPGEVILWIPNALCFRAMPKNWEECQLASFGPERPAIAWAWIGKGLHPLDSAAGGTGTFWQQTGDAVNFLRVLARVPELCFVPTTSALDCADDIWYQAPTTAEGAANRHWDDWYFPPNNEAHVKLTRPIKEFIASRIGRAAMAGA